VVVDNLDYSTTFCTTYGFSSQLAALSDNIVSVVQGGGNYYLVTQKASVIILNGSFSSPLSVDNSGLGYVFYGPAIYNNNGYLYMATSGGIKAINNSGTFNNTSISRGASSYSQFFYNPINLITGFIGGFGNYNFSTINLGENWFVPVSPQQILYSPIVQSYFTSTLSFVDNSGYLNIYDAGNSSTKASFIYSQYIGTIDIPNLKIAKDSSENTIFVPISSPPSIVSFSLNWALSQRQ
jgi:hypothetical protein